MDKAPHFEFNCTNYKSLCDDETFKHLAEPQANIMKTYNLDPEKIPVQFVQARLDAVNGDINSISVTGPESDKFTIQYDVLVLCTGATYSSPWRDGPEEMKTLEQRDHDYKQVREAIRKSNRILIAGAGATGLEAAGYIKEKYPDHKVGICLRGKTLLPYVKDGRKIVEAYLKELDIEVHYETPYEGDLTRDSLGYDYCVDCRGYKFVAPKRFMRGELAKCVEP